jgi:hypothetical protein
MIRFCVRGSFPHSMLAAEIITKQTLGAVLLLISFSSFASDLYRWEAYGFYATSSNNAVTACHLYIDDMIGGAKAGKQFEGVSLTSPTAGLCFYSYDYDTQLKLRKTISYDLRRLGDTCPANTVYNKNSSACDTVPVTVGQPCYPTLPDGEPYITSTDGSCLPYSKSPSAEGVPSKLSCIADPIDISSGNTYLRQVDLPETKDGTISFSRTYNSIDGVWRHNYSTNLLISPEMVVLRKSDGKESYFSRQSSTGNLSSNDDGELEFLDKSWIYKARNGSSYYFSEGGRLDAIKDRGGNGQSVAYEGNSIRVSDDFGGSVIFNEDFLHQPTRLTAENVAISYTYDSDFKLTSLQKKFGSSNLFRGFSYAAELGKRLLTAITDERNIEFASWKYDKEGRAISSQHSGGAGLIHVSYNVDGSSTVTNELGKNTVYRYQQIGGIKRVASIEGEPSANCPESNSTYTYNERGQVLTKTDAKGLITVFMYDNRGLETSRTEASGTPSARTITTEWDAARFLPVRVVEPYRTTFYSYDMQGRELGRQTTPR